MRRFIAEWGETLEVDLLALGLDLPRDIGTPRLTWQRARRVIENLPDSSATARARRNQAPGIEVQFLRRIDHAARLNVWAQTEDGSKGRNQPEMVPLVGDRTMNGKSRDALELTDLLAARQAKRQAELLRMGGGGNV